jgi:hypothetical protein
MPVLSEKCRYVTHQWVSRFTPNGLTKSLARLTGQNWTNSKTFIARLHASSDFRYVGFSLYSKLWSEIRMDVIILLHTGFNMLEASWRIIIFFILGTFLGIMETEYIGEFYDGEKGFSSEMRVLVASAWNCKGSWVPIWKTRLGNGWKSSQRDSWDWEWGKYMRKRCWQTKTPGQCFAIVLSTRCILRALLRCKPSVTGHCYVLGLHWCYSKTLCSLAYPAFAMAYCTGNIEYPLLPGAVLVE